MSKHDCKSISLLRLLRRLEAGDSLTTDQIADEFGVSRRTAQRWVKDINVVMPLELHYGRYRRMQAA